MFIKTNEIAGKYIIELGKKKILNRIKYNDASSSIKQAVEETANLAKKSIEDAVEPLKAKIAQKDEFIASQKTLNSTLQSQNEDLKQANTLLKSEIEEKNSQNSLLQTTLKKYHPIMKEAYKQGITPEIREQKTGISGILTSLLSYKSKTVKPNIKDQVKKEIIKTPQNILETSKTEAKPIIKQSVFSTVKTPKTVQKNRVNVKSEPISKEILAKIENERKNQVLDKKRIVAASALIKKLEEGLTVQPKTNMPHIYEYYRKIDINKLLQDSNGISAVKRTWGHGDYSLAGTLDVCDKDYITFFDKNNKKLLSTQFGDKTFTHTIFDENGVTMVGILTKNGVVDALAVDFNEVKPIPEILHDKAMDDYAQNAINQAKAGTISKFKEGCNGTGYNNYYNADGTLAVKEDIPNLLNKNSPKATYILNLENGECAKSFWMNKSRLDSLNKYRNNGDKEFYIYFAHDNEDKFGGNQAYMYLMDKQHSPNAFGYVYNKNIYGLVSHPVTKRFSLFNLSEHNMKPWDLSNLNILKPYLK